MEYGNLSLREATLLLVLRDDPNASTKEAMRLSGISSPARLYTTRKILNNLGLLPERTEEYARAVPDRGPPKEPNSAKIGRIMRAYRSVFKSELKPVEAGQLLKAADVEVVIGTFQKVKDRNIHKPFPYTLAILRSGGEQRMEQKLNGKAPAPVFVPDPEVPQPPSEAYLKELERLKGIKFSEWEY